MKTCTKCHIEKELKDFPFHDGFKDGRDSRCRECKGKYYSEYRNRHLQSLREKNKEYSKEYYDEHITIPEYVKKYRIKNKKYSKTPAGKEKARIGAYKMIEKYPEKYKARYQARAAIYAGKLIRKPCRDCGELKVEAHHPDYSKPLDVIFLCLIHHRILHGRYIQLIREGEDQTT